MNALELKQVSKHYPGFDLENLTLSLPGGCILGLIGENGAGKSTTIRLMLGLARPDSGSITLLGRDIGDDLRLTKEDIGVVLDNVGIPNCLNAQQVGKVMAGTYARWNQAQYEGYLRQLAIPEKKAFKDFSRGMQMKLGIAIALSHDAKLLILDEATSGLDPVVRDEVVEMFRQFTQDENHSVLISSHIVSDLEKRCDYIAFLHKGKLLLMEEKDRLLEEYALALCSDEQLARLPEQAVKSCKRSAYGAEALVLRQFVPEGIHTRPVTIEELFIFMVKEAN